MEVVAGVYVGLLYPDLPGRIEENGVYPQSE
jgi:hypothetical protein